VFVRVTSFQANGYVVKLIQTIHRLRRQAAE